MLVANGGRHLSSRTTVTLLPPLHSSPPSQYTRSPPRSPTLFVVDIMHLVRRYAQATGRGPRARLTDLLELDFLPAARCFLALCLLQRVAARVVVHLGTSGRIGWLVRRESRAKQLAPGSYHTPIGPRTRAHRHNHRDNVALRPADGRKSNGACMPDERARVRTAGQAMCWAGLPAGNCSTALPRAPAPTNSSGGGGVGTRHVGGCTLNLTGLLASNAARTFSCSTRPLRASSRALCAPLMLQTGRVGALLPRCRRWGCLLLSAAQPPVGHAGDANRARTRRTKGRRSCLPPLKASAEPTRRRGAPVQKSHLPVAGADVTQVQKAHNVAAS